MIYIILFVGLILRVISLNQSLWLDEATTALAAKLSLVDLFTKFLPGDFHPPLYYLILKYWTALFGYSEISLRIPSIIFGLGTIYLTFLIGKKLFDKKIALAASALLATSGLAIYYSQEARMYSLAAFLVTAAIYAFIKKRWIFLSAILVLIGMTDYVALLILPVFLLADLKNWKKVAVSCSLLVIFFVAWLPVFVHQLLNGVSLTGSNWWNILGLPTLKNAALIPVKFVLGRISFDNKIIYGLITAITLGIFGYLGGVGIKAIKTTKLILIWLIIPILLGIVVSFKIPTLSYFRFLFCLPALYLLTAFGISKLGKRLGTIALILVLLINVASTGYYLFFPKFHREDWRSLVKFVESQKTADSITIFVADSNTEAYRYYAPNAKIAGPEGIKKGYDQVWLMRYVQDVFDPGDKVRGKIESLGYKISGEYNFNGVGVWKYSKK